MLGASDVIQAPLSRNELSQRYRELCDNPLFNNIPGKIEIDIWGRLLFLPFSTLRGLDGECFASPPILTSAGVLVADFGWASREFMRAHDYETPLTSPPEICVETTSAFNSTKELRDKIDACLAAGAEEVWIAYLQSKHCEFYDKNGLQAGSRYNPDLSALFK